MAATVAPVPPTSRARSGERKAGGGSDGRPVVASTGLSAASREYHFAAINVITSTGKKFKIALKNSADKGNAGGVAGAFSAVMCATAKALLSRELNIPIEKISLRRRAEAGAPPCPVFHDHEIINMTEGPAPTPSATSSGAGAAAGNLTAAAAAVVIDLIVAGEEVKTQLAPPVSLALRAPEPPATRPRSPPPPRAAVEAHAYQAESVLPSGRGSASTADMACVPVRHPPISSGQTAAPAKRSPPPPLASASNPSAANTAEDPALVAAQADMRPTPTAMSIEPPLPAVVRGSSVGSSHKSGASSSSSGHQQQQQPPLQASAPTVPPTAASPYSRPTATAPAAAAVAVEALMANHRSVSEVAAGGGGGGAPHQFRDGEADGLGPQRVSMMSSGVGAVPPQDASRGRSPTSVSSGSTDPEGPAPRHGGAQLAAADGGDMSAVAMPVAAAQPSARTTKPLAMWPMAASSHQGAPFEQPRLPRPAPGAAGVSVYGIPVTALPDGGGSSARRRRHRRDAAGGGSDDDSDDRSVSPAAQAALAAIHVLTHRTSAAASPPSLGRTARREGPSGGGHFHHHHPSAAASNKAVDPRAPPPHHQQQQSSEIYQGGYHYQAAADARDSGGWLPAAPRHASHGQTVEESNLQSHQIDEGRVAVDDRYVRWATAQGYAIGGQPPYPGVDGKIARGLSTAAPPARLPPPPPPPWSSASGSPQAATQYGTRHPRSASPPARELSTAVGNGLSPAVEIDVVDDDHDLGYRQRVPGEAFASSSLAGGGGGGSLFPSRHSMASDYHHGAAAAPTVGNYRPTVTGQLEAEVLKLEEEEHERQHQSRVQELEDQLSALQRLRQEDTESENRTIGQLARKYDHAVKARVAAISAEVRRIDAEMGAATVALDKVVVGFDTLRFHVSESDQQSLSDRHRVQLATKKMDAMKDGLVAALAGCGCREPADEEAAATVLQLACQKHLTLVQLNDGREKLTELQGALDSTTYHRRALHNSVEDVKGNIRVVVRMRVKLPGDDAGPYHITRHEEGSVIADDVANMVTTSSPSSGTRSFEFFRVYAPPTGGGGDSLGRASSPNRPSSASSPSTTWQLPVALQNKVAVQQRQLFEEQLRPLLRSVFDGVNVSVIAYGQTGSGKTFTILGDINQPASQQTSHRKPSASAADGLNAMEGLLPRALRAVMQEREAMTRGGRPSAKASSRVAASLTHAAVMAVSVSAIELYLDQPYDLFALPNAVGAPGGGGGVTGSGDGATFSSVLGASSTAAQHHASVLPQSQGKRLEFKSLVKGGAMVLGATERPVTDADHGIALISEALNRRTTHPTLMNVQSSRSHLIISIRCTMIVDPASSAPRSSFLVFVDLAGSERLSKSLSAGDRLKETQYINKSLASLGDVVAALTSTAAQGQSGASRGATGSQSLIRQHQRDAARKPTGSGFAAGAGGGGSDHGVPPTNRAPVHVPYRASRLTQLLQSCIGGDAKTLIVTCLCPHLPAQHNLHESLSALHFASRARLVRNSAKARDRAASALLASATVSSSEFHSSSATPEDEEIGVRRRDEFADDGLVNDGVEQREDEEDYIRSDDYADEGDADAPQEYLPAARAVKPSPPFLNVGGGGGTAYAAAAERSQGPNRDVFRI